MTLIRQTLERPLWLVAFIVAIIVLVIAPRDARPYTVISLITILLFVNLTLSWTIFSGPSHYISLATAAFFGIGLYTATVIGRELPLPAIIAIACLICFVLAFAMGLLTLRLRGIYFILFTFGVSELIRHSVTWWEIHQTQTVGRFVRGANNETVYYYMVAIAVITLVTAYIIQHTKLGLALKGIGENEVAAAHIGINVTLVKVISFSITAIFMGATGAVFANRLNYVDPTIAFNPLYSFLPVLMAIFGGTSRLYGPILGAVVFTILRETLITEFPYLYMLLMGATLILVISFLPGGLVGLIDKVNHRLNRYAPYRKMSMRLRGWLNVSR